MPSAIFNPIQANYFLGGQLPLKEQAIIGGLMLLGAGAMTGYGLFFSYPAAVAGPAALETATITFVGPEGVAGSFTYVIGGVELTTTQLQMLAAMQAGSMATEPVAVAAICSSWGLKMLSLEGILALAAFDVTHGNLPGHFGNFGGYLGGNPGNGFGGFSTPPGFPGFPATTVYGNRHRVCYVVETNGLADIVCFYED